MATKSEKMSPIDAYFAGRDDLRAVYSRTLENDRRALETARESAEMARERFDQLAAEIRSLTDSGIAGGLAAERRAGEGDATPSLASGTRNWARGYGAAFESIDAALRRLNC